MADPNHKQYCTAGVACSTPSFLQCLLAVYRSWRKCPGIRSRKLIFCWKEARGPSLSVSNVDRRCWPGVERFPLPPRRDSLKAGCAGIDQSESRFLFRVYTKYRYVFCTHTTVHCKRYGPSCHRTVMFCTPTRAHARLRRIIDPVAELLERDRVMGQDKICMPHVYVTLVVCGIHGKRTRYCRSVSGMSIFYGGSPTFPSMLTVALRIE